MGFKSIDGLMRHLRNKGIDIGGSTQKRQLVNTGYFHGHKGYRFFKQSQNRLPFTSYSEIYATIQYDRQLKTLFYDKIMFIETAVKNIALGCILQKVNSENIQDMCDKAVSSYKNAPAGTPNDKKKRFQQNKLSLQNTIQSYLFRAYKSGNPQITHFYNNMGHSCVPIWALFEVMMLGDFGFLLSCLTYEMRDDISRELGINMAVDTNRELVYKYIYTFKDLRNAVAHNDVVFDTRFRRIEPNRAMKRCLEEDIGVSYMNFKTIGDYVLLICYYLKLLKIPKTEIKSFIRDFEKFTNDYRKSIDSNVAALVIHPDLASRLNVLKKFI